ncbi:hypothetical protein EDD21DRAFT_350947 [Dissophora ornata]|nr:hypothetical protein EDD21DRAFT_350947 [Dissophora ornata]
MITKRFPELEKPPYVASSPALQAFRAATSTGTVYIPARLDSKTGENVVLWKDIQMAFNKPRCIMSGSDVVVFMVDDDFQELVPLRIAYHPGLVLEVIIGDSVELNNDVSKVLTKDPDPCPTSPTTIATDIDLKATVWEENVAIPSPLVEQIDDANSTDKSLVICSDDTRVSLSNPNSLPLNSEVQAQSESIRNALHLGFESTLALLEKNRTLQEEHRKMMDEMLRLQTQTLERLAIVQNRIESTITQNYELHEYPIPRLFVVLPKAKRIRETLDKPLSKEFRLYFLCECGSHTMAEGSRAPHEIHLAKHDGYDINKPDEFFQKYGPYALIMMEMVKYGYMTRGIVIPSLAHFKVVEGIEAVREKPDIVRHDFASLVDSSITFIQGQMSNPSGRVDLPTEPVDLDRAVALDRMEVLKGADLRRLESYLRVQDNDRVLGNLYRIATAEGNVKWVCNDHYRENYRQSSMMQLKDVVRVNGGTFIEETGKVEVNVGTRNLARQLYDAMVKARGIQELDIALQWDVTLNDLRVFSSAVTKANIINLTLNGEAFKGPALDIINRRRRFDPILQLMGNMRIQSLQLKRFKNFFGHISIGQIFTCPQLRVLQIDTTMSRPEQDTQLVVKKILDSCLSLTELKLTSSDLNFASNLIVDKIDQFKNLENIALEINNQIMTINASQGKIQDVTITITQLKDFSTDGLFLKEHHVHRLHVKKTLDDVEMKQLRDVLRRSTQLSELRIGCRLEQALVLIDIIQSERSDALITRRSCALRKVELAEDEENADGDTTNKDALRMTLDFPDATKIGFAASTELTMGNTWSADASILSSIFDMYGWSIVKLTTNEMFDDNLAALLDSTTENEGSRLTSLTVNLASLTWTGADGMARVIHRSKGLERLGLTLHRRLRDAGLRTSPRRLLSQQRESAATLLLEGTEASSHLLEIAILRLCGHKKLHLDTCGLVDPDMSKLPQDCASPINDLISAQHSQPEPSSGSKLELADMLVAIKEFSLQGYRLTPERWQTVIRSFDFFELEILDFKDTNFSMEQLKIFVKLLPEGYDSMVQLRFLGLKDTELAKCDPTYEFRELYVDLRRKAPLVEIDGLNVAREI